MEAGRRSKVFFYSVGSALYNGLIGHLRRLYPYAYPSKEFDGVERPKQEYLSLSRNWADEFSTCVTEVNLLHRMACNGSITEIKMLERMPIEEYASTINAWKYELHLKQKSVKV